MRIQVDDRGVVADLPPRRNDFQDTKPVEARALNKALLALVAAEQSYRQIGMQLDLSKNTVLGIVKRERAKTGSI